MSWTFYLHPTQRLFGCRVVYVRLNGLSIDKVVGRTSEKAMERAKVKYP